LGAPNPHSSLPLFSFALSASLHRLTFSVLKYHTYEDQLDALFASKKK